MSESQLIVLLYLLVGLRLLLHILPQLLGEGWRRWSNEIIDAVVVAGITALLLINFVVRSFFIPSGSMEPTLVVDDYILVNELVYRFFEPQRGDIVVFRPPAKSGEGDRDFIKRVVGIEGDVIEVRDGRLVRNGQRIEESYVPEKAFDDFGPELVRPGQVFVMGDNRNSSYDSRRWGQLPIENVLGRAFMVFMNSKSPYWLKLHWLPVDGGLPAVES